MEEVLNGVVQNIIFHNEENEYTVFSLEVDYEDVICIGNLIGIAVGENIEVHGNWSTHKTYGDQFKVKYYEKKLPTSKEAIKKYLASGSIKGIGEVIADRIVDMFGEDTFKVIEKTPQELTKIKGISKRIADNIEQTFKEQYDFRKVALFLQNFDISLTYAVKIYKKYEEKTIEVIEKNPYKLTDDISGIGFKLADKIAVKMGVEVDSIFRIKAAIKYILRNEAINGNVYLDKNNLKFELNKLVNINEEILENILLEVQMENYIVVEDNKVYLQVLYKEEQNVARRLVELSDYKDKKEYDIDARIKRNEKRLKITLADKQKEAVKKALTEGVLVITGGPGTGKTTIINMMLDILESDAKKITLAAPTGRAAKRMTETTNRDSSTIHRLLEFEYMGETTSTQTFNKNEDNPIDADVIILDEASMIDISLMNHLLKAVTDETRLILVGDADQLPSVGPGNVLKDIIKSKEIKVIKLNKVYRQNDKSEIAINAHKINNGEYPVFNQKDKDFFIVRKSTQQKTLEEVLNLAECRIPEFNKCDPIQDIQILSPMKKGIAGVKNLNEQLQKSLNKKSITKNEKKFRKRIFRTGDKIMQIKNNYTLEWKIRNELGIIIEEGKGIFNGDQGIITDISENKSKVKVLFNDDKIVEYNFNQLDELTHAYAITIHKSQGSEYDVVILPLISGPKILMTRNLLYTAITRAKKMLIIVGSEKMVRSMIDNNREFRRNSNLHEKIKEIKKLFN